MITGVTYGVKISVESIYRKDLSNIENNVYFFNYRVVIENTNSFNIKLLSRHWHIFDSLNPAKVIEGDGVVGEQPIIKPGQKHVYVSGCDLNSEMGYMKGFYNFIRVDTQEKFKAEIPRFELVSKPKLN